MTTRTSGSGEPGPRPDPDSSDAHAADEAPSVPAPRGERADEAQTAQRPTPHRRSDEAARTEEAGRGEETAHSDESARTEETAAGEAGEAGALGEPEEAEEEYRGPLDRDAVRRVVGASTVMIATGDRHGERNVSVLVGESCFVRVLDGHHLAFPDEGVEGSTALRANLAEASGIGMLLIGSGGAGGRRGLHLNGTAEVIPAETLREQHPDLPADPVPGRSTDVWIVVAVGDAYTLDGDDVPPIGPGDAAAPAGASGPGRGGGGRVLPVLVVLLVLGLLAVGIVALSLVDRTSTAAPAEAPAGESAPPGGPSGTAGAPGGPTGPPTLYGRVLDVPTPATVVVDVGGTPVTVDVIGIDDATIPSCAQPTSLSFARTTLSGQTVTLVPDPTLPPGPATQAYVVLDTQLSYTDAAIQAGAAPASGRSQYRAVFDREQTAAADDGVGMWGPPCRP